MLFYLQNYLAANQGITPRQVKQCSHETDEENYEAVPQWWFYALLLLVIGLAMLACEL